MRNDLRFNACLENPSTFLDEIWPTALARPNKSTGQGANSSCKDNFYEDYDQECGLTELRKWRIQTLLAVSGWGIPSLAFADAYEKMFGRPFVIQEFGFNLLSDMIHSLPDIFTIQEPDEVTKLLFPQFPHDKILHDARFGHDFSAKLPESQYEFLNKDYRTLDRESLISYAWLNRDDDFPSDVVLAGEQYCDYILPITEAQVPNANGAHKAIMIGAANPSHVYLNIKNENTERVKCLSVEVKQYFQERWTYKSETVDMYRVPKEFIYPSFPCLIYIESEDSWERGAVVAMANKADRVIVEPVDYGGVRMISRHNIFLMPKKFFGFPPQSVLVSIAGLKPRPKNGLKENRMKWSRGSGSRTRCFSYPKYFLDCLLLDPPTTVEAIEDQSGEEKLCQDLSENFSSSTTSSDVQPTGSEVELKPILKQKSASRLRSDKMRKALKKKPQYEAIICDRNEEGIDIYLDEILVTETYALVDESREREVRMYKEKFKEALKGVSRPKNPMKGLVFKLKERDST